MRMFKFLILFFLLANWSISFTQNSRPQDKLNSKSADSLLIKANRSFVDKRDNREYLYIDIGGILWMAENLNYQTPNSLTYNNNNNLGNTFGRLYTWEEAKCSCPENWRLPSEEDWKKLEAFIGLSPLSIDSTGWRGEEFGNLLKNKSNEMWLGSSSSDHVNNGFDVIPGGVAYNKNYFANLGMGGYFWSASNYYSSFAWSRYFNSMNGEIFRNISVNSWYLSVRCIND